MQKWKKILQSALILAVLAAVPAFAAVSAPAQTVESSITTDEVDKLEYVLYVPKDAPENLPLIVYLHGHGKGGSVDSQQDEVLTYLKEEATGESPAYVLAPVLPMELDFGAAGMWPGIEKTIMQLINTTAADYKIDPARIHLTGLSMGADSAIQIAALHPDTFASITGIIPFHEKCPVRKWEEGWGEKLKTVPMWLFVEDLAPAKEMADQAVSDMTAAGGQIWVEVQEGTDHGGAGKAVKGGLADRKIQLYDWILSVKRPEAAQ